MKNLRQQMVLLALGCALASAAFAQPVRLGVSATLTGPNAVNGVSGLSDGKFEYWKTNWFGNF